MSAVLREERRSSVTVAAWPGRRANRVRARFGLRKIHPVATALKSRRQRLTAAKKDDQPVNFTIFGCERLTQPAG